LSYGQQIIAEAVSNLGLFRGSGGHKSFVFVTADKHVSHGGNSMKVYTTSNLVNHLKPVSSELHKVYEDKFEKYLEEQGKKQLSNKRCLN